MIKIMDVFAKIKNPEEPVLKRAMMVLMLLWSVDLMLSCFITGVRELNPYVIFTWLIKALVLIINIWFFKQLFIKENVSLFEPLRTYLGYMVILVYIISSLPRLSWEQEGIISDPAALGLWINTIVMCLFPLILYVMMLQKSVKKLWAIKQANGVNREITTEQSDHEAQSSSDQSQGKAVKKKKSLLEHILENGNILLQAIIMVILINHFVFQLYVIPSGSMIPTFLLNDRPVVLKALSGPTIPLTSWQLPVIKEPGRGDVVIFETHRYTKPPLYMQILQNFLFLATLSMWDINRTGGNVEPQYIVKRIIGVPGDKLMMVDDKVYVKRRGEAEFSLLEVDVEKYAHPDAYISAEDREILDHFDALKNSRSLSEWYEQWKTLRQTLGDKFNKLTAQAQSEFTSGINVNLINTWRKIWSQTRKPDENALDLYEISSRKTNYLYHILAAELLEAGLDIVITPDNKSLMDRYFQAASEFNQFNGKYLGHYFTRNFAAFPKGENEFIPEKQYFLMGDNRYNSLDFRYGDVAVDIRLDPDDPYSWGRTTRLNPFLLPQKKILGMAVARIWPPERMGLVLP